MNNGDGRDWWSRGLDWLFPGGCAVCGGFAPGRCHGVCSRCAESLVPVAGRQCEHCGRELLGAGPLCVQCRSRDPASREREAFALPCRACFAYDEGIARILAQFKGHADRRLAPWIAERLIYTLRALSAEPAGNGVFLSASPVLVPMPGSPRSVRRRGWDHMEEVAVCLRRRGFTVRSVLQRRTGPAQKGLDREARQRAMAHCLLAAPSLRSGRRSRSGGRSRFDGRSRSGGRSPAGTQTASRSTEVVILDDVRTTGASMNAAAEVLRREGMRPVCGIVLALR